MLRRAFSAVHRTESVEAGVRAWVSRITSKTDVQTDRIDPYKLRLLDLTLPPFGTAQDVPELLEQGERIIPGTELTLFPPLVRTSALLPDGTDQSYSSPAPFSRRMWAGGAFAFDAQNPLLVGQEVKCETTVEDVELKGWDKARESGELGNEAMVFVKQQRKVSNEIGVAVVERRTHVYRPELAGESAKGTDEKLGVKGKEKKLLLHADQLPPDEQFTFTPSAHTLFRFSALTFNAHRIHLDPIYSVQQEGHEDRLVHGPLTALLLLRLAHANTPPGSHIAAFQYRATHPLVVDRPLSLNLRWVSGSRQTPNKGNKPTAVDVWATNDKGVVGMRGSVVFGKNEDGISWGEMAAIDAVAGVFTVLE
ncbi:hypothetical protein BDV93DRAFT_606158 [Ceratobasidium sp. AG-I]|nr:hypothetical protein BDV93DRAFT_606158 [Ceratobasidium sp. AG-I]